MKTKIVSLLIFISTACIGQVPTLGVAYGPSYNGDNYIKYIEELGVQTHINIWWDETEPNPGNYKYAVVDSFVNQLKNSTVALLRISARYNAWATNPPDYTVPANLSVNGPYFNYVFNIVKRTNGKVKYFENEWEADTKHWGGTEAEYAELMRTFYEAVKTADSTAIVIMGGSLGGTFPNNFFNMVFLDLASDQEANSFDMFDLHLYNGLYDIPGRIQWFRNAMDAYTEFFSKPIVVTEYGGPTPQEFNDSTDTFFEDLYTELIQDTCLISGDLTSTPLHPSGYPDKLRMFAYGIDSALDAKRDSIQARQMIQRTLLALSAGAQQLYWWNIKDKEPKDSIPCYFRNPIFGKLQLMKYQNDTLSPNPTFYYYKTISGKISDTVKWVNRIPTVNDSVYYLFQVKRNDDSIIYVVWEKRNQFDGGSQPPTSFTFNVPWSAVKITDVFGTQPSATPIGGSLTVNITDTPVFIEESVATSTEDAQSIQNNYINIFPNPSICNFIIEIKNGKSQMVNSIIEIYNVLGEKIAENTIPVGVGNLKMDLKNQPGGIYFLKIKNGTKIFHEKLLIQK